MKKLPVVVLSITELPKLPNSQTAEFEFGVIC